MHTVTLQHLVVTLNSVAHSCVTLRGTHLMSPIRIFSFNPPANAGEARDMGSIPG